MKSSLRFWILLAALVVFGVLVNSWAYLGEAHVTRKELKIFPSQLGNWKQTGVDYQLDAQTLSVLRASDYLLRDYRNAEGQQANYYVGYYATQRDGASYHSPLNCLPGSGWTMSNGATTSVNLASGQTFEVNQYVIANGNVRELMLYWYQGRGRVVASEYWGKVYTVVDSVRMRRSDAAMVRVTVPITTTEAAALATAKEFAAATSSVLPDFVPN
jgi:EpsI family protein